MKSKFCNIFKLKKLSVIIATISILLICCLTLTACDPGSYYFEPEELSDIVSVELINYNNPEQKHFLSWVPDHTSKLKPFDDSKLSVLETLEEDKIAQFTDVLCECNILYKYYAYDSPNGTCLKLSYSNGDFLIINCNMPSFAGYIGKFTSGGEVAEFIGCFSSSYYFKTLVNDYFQMKLKD